MSEPVDKCLHCAMVAAVNAWNEQHNQGGTPSGLMVMEKVAKVAGELISQVPMADRGLALAMFGGMVAKRCGFNTAMVPAGLTVAEPSSGSVDDGTRH